MSYKCEGSPGLDGLDPSTAQEMGRGRERHHGTQGQHVAASLRAKQCLEARPEGDL